MCARVHVRGSTAGLLAALSLLAGSAAGGDASVDRVLAEMGEPYFEAYCTSCHGLAGEGDGLAASGLNTPPADLARIAARRGGAFPDGEIAKHIDGRFDVPERGARDMPVWGRRLSESVPEAGARELLTRGKIAVLVEYLKAIQVSDPAQGVAE
jgi:mono/diheme cytochrome c family protein